MSTADSTATNHMWTAAELRRLPPDERDAILSAVAELAQDEYRLNLELTDFEAFDEDDGHDRDSDAQPG